MEKKGSDSFEYYPYVNFITDEELDEILGNQ